MVKPSNNSLQIAMAGLLFSDIKFTCFYMVSSSSAFSALSQIEADLTNNVQEFINRMMCDDAVHQPSIRAYFRAKKGVQRVRGIVLHEIGRVLQLSHLYPWQVLELLRSDCPSAQISSSSICQTMAFNDFVMGNAMLQQGVALFPFDCWDDASPTNCLCGWGLGKGRFRYC